MNRFTLFSVGVGCGAAVGFALGALLILALPWGAAS